MNVKFIANKRNPYYSQLEDLSESCSWSLRGTEVHGLDLAKLQLYIIKLMLS